MRAVRLAVLFAITFAFVGVASADPPTGYACPPGVPDKGIGCKCPAGYKSKVEDGIAMCATAGTQRPPPPKLNYDQLLSKANGLADTNCKAAEVYFAQAIQLKPNGIEALVGSGNCHIEQRKWDAAQARFRAAIAVNNKHEGALWGTAEAYRMAGKKPEAIAAYRRYLDVFPGSTSAQAALDKLQAGAKGDAKGAPARTADVTVAISGSRLLVMGKEVPGSPMMTDIIAILGKPDRLWSTEGAINQIHTWDKLGMIAYESIDGGTPSGKMISLTMPFRAMTMDYEPRIKFGGSITVDGSKLSGTTDLAEANKRPGATQPYGAGSVVFPKGEFNVFINSKSGTGPIDLVELSMWKKPQANTGGAGGGKISRASDLKISITGARVVMNGAAISGKPMVADLEAVYGKPDRTWDQGTGNKVYTWDKLGLVGYEPRDQPGRLISATFPFKAMGVGYDPKTMFDGSITVDGGAMGPSDTLAEVKARPGATQPYSGTSIVFDKGDVHVFTMGKGTTLELVELSFWQKETNAPPPPKVKVTSSASVNITIAGTKMTINGVAITGKPMVADFEAVFGKPDRTWDTKGGVNKVHTWDKIGLLVYEPYDARCISATFPFKPLGMEFDPQAMFAGSITVDGSALTNTTSLASVKARTGATQPYGAGSVIFDKQDMHVFVQADTDAKPIELVEIGFWQKDKK